MKKKGIFIAAGLIALVVMVVGVLLLVKPWGSKNDGSEKNNENSKIERNDAGDESVELLAPNLEWWELYNPNGFDTVTAVIYNDNDVAVDVSYDLVYYKNGKQVAKSEGFSNFGILPRHKDVIWANFDIPKASEVDEVKMENVEVTESYYGAIDGKYEYLGITDFEARFRFEFEKKPRLANIWFVLYDDKNGDGKCGKGEIVVVDTDSIEEQVGEASFATDVYDYTDFEVYFSAQE